MRGLFQFVVLLIAAIAIGVGFLILRPPSWWPRAATFSAITGKALGNVESRTNPFAKPKPVEKSRTARPQPRSSASAGSVTVTVILPPPTGTPRRFPLAQEITKGMTKSAVLAICGPPEATVTGADVGQLLERLLYLDASTRRTTLIFFVDGNVIRAETYTQ
jgi:hypothetical protein